MEVDGTCSECDPLSHLCNNDDELRTKRDEVTESWRKLHNEDPSTICILYQIAYYYDDQMSEQCKLVCMGEMKYAYNILVGKPGRTQPIGRPTSRCEAKVKIDLKKKVVRV